MGLSELERRSAMACLAAIEANGAELLGMVDWCAHIGPDRRRELQDFMSAVRAYRHDIENLRVANPTGCSAGSGPTR